MLIRTPPRASEAAGAVLAASPYASRAATTFYNIAFVPRTSVDYFGCHFSLYSTRTLQRKWGGQGTARGTKTASSARTQKGLNERLIANKALLMPQSRSRLDMPCSCNRHVVACLDNTPCARAQPFTRSSLHCETAARAGQNFKTRPSEDSETYLES